jgi:hypothetical protein
MQKSTVVDQAQADINNMWWAGAIVLALLGLYICGGSWKAGVVLILSAALISPYGFNRVLEYFKVGDPLHARVLIVLFALAGSTYVFIDHTAQMMADKAEDQRVAAFIAAREADQKKALEEQKRTNAAKAYFAEHRAEVIAEFTAAVDANDLKKADEISQKYDVMAQDPEFSVILTRYQVLKYRAKQAAEEQEKKDKIAALVAKTKTLGATDYGQAIAIYTELTTLDPTNKGYKQTLDRFRKAEDARLAKIEKERIATAEKAERQKKIEAQFSGWSGAHYTFERMIKDSMNDPDSYSHVETKYIDKGTFIRVFCTFRGKNGFGGMVKNTKVADFSLDGNFLREVQ